MQRSAFIKQLGLGSAGLLLPKSLLDKQPIKIYDNYVRGLPHYDYKKIKKQIKEGDELTLKREPNNAYDGFATQTFFQSYKLGYLSAYENIVLANMLDSGTELKAFVSKHNKHENYMHTLAIEVYAELVAPTPKLLKLEKDLRADDHADIYRGDV